MGEPEGKDVRQSRRRERKSLQSNSLSLFQSYITHALTAPDTPTPESGSAPPQPPHLREANPQALAPWELLELLTPAPHEIFRRAKRDLDWVVLRVVWLEPLDASADAQHEVNHLKLVVEAWAVVEDEDAVVLRIGIQVRQDALLESDEELGSVVAALDDVRIDHAKEAEHS